MTDKFENIDCEEIKMNDFGELEISDALLDAVSGGFNPEEEEEELPDTNNGCTVHNNKGCD
jgi:hypothetical protein